MFIILFDLSFFFLFFFILFNMSDPVNTATDTSEAPALQVPPKDSATETAPANHTASTAATATGVNATGPKVTPVQRLSSVYKKAKQTVTDAVAEANKAINEKKATKPAAAATEGATTDTDAVTAVTTTADPVATSQVPTATQGKKVGTSNIAFKDLLARVKVNQTGFFCCALYFDLTLFDNEI